MARWIQTLTGSGPQHGVVALTAALQTHRHRAIIVARLALTRARCQQNITTSYLA